MKNLLITIDKFSCRNNYYENTNNTDLERCNTKYLDPNYEVKNKFSRRKILRGAIVAGITGASVAATLMGSGFGINHGYAALPNPPRSSPGHGVDELAPSHAPYAFVASASDRADWASFKDRFIDRGRVIDTGNRGVSHTEGQGSGMMFAVAFDDRETFDAIWNWTHSTLRRPNDALHAWRYDPRGGQPVVDWNNATDGDLLIAGALARAARRWGSPVHAEAARAIAEDVILKLARPVAGRTVLLPGISGFEGRDVTIVNPSYYVFPLLTELAAFSPSPRWEALVLDGLALIDEARFGRWGLPPDWLQINARTGALAPAEGWPARFSYDAIRIPLYLAWGGRLSQRLAEQCREFWESYAGSSAWVDLRSGAEAEYAADIGMRAISRFVMLGGAEPPARLGRVASAPNYYSAALLLFTRLAWRETAERLSWESRPRDPKRRPTGILRENS